MFPIDPNTEGQGLELMAYVTGRDTPPRPADMRERIVIRLCRKYFGPCLMVCEVSLVLSFAIRLAILRSRAIVSLFGRVRHVPSRQSIR